MTHTEPDLRERRAIEDMLKAKMAVSKIAAEIGRHRSTVYREIKRNRYFAGELPELNGYYGMNAQRTAVNRRARCRKLVRFAGLRRHVIEQLVSGWSPEQIAGRLQYDGQPLRVSHETIYGYVYSPDGQSEGLARYLPHRRKKRQPRRRRTPRGLVFPPDRSIHERPDYVKARKGIVRLFSLTEGLLTCVTSSGKFVGAVIPLMKCGCSRQAIGRGCHMVAAGAEQVCGFIMNGQKPLRLAS